MDRLKTPLPTAGKRPAAGDRGTPPGGAGGGFLFDPVVGPVFAREGFSSEQRDIDRMVRDFARERILPHRAELDSLDRDLSRGLLREVAELGLTGIDIPERYGGLGLDKTTSALVVEALTTGGSASWVVTFSAHVGIGTLPIVFFGSEDQKQRYLPGLASAEVLGAYALTEPEAGSDALSIRSSARLSEDGEVYRLNGTKQYVTNGGWADLFVIFASAEGAGVTAFIVERETPGLGIGPEEHKMGIKGSSTVSLSLDDVPVPRGNLLGTPGAGHLIAFNILNIGRFKLGAADLGGCKTAIDETVAYALERRQFGQPIAFFEAIRKKLADMVVRTYVLDSAIYHTVGLMDRRISTLDPGAPDHSRRVVDALEEYAIESSIGKILGSETMFRVADHGVQVFGGYGFSEEYPMAAMFRDCRIDRIFEGTNEINRMVIYGYYLKKALMESLPLRLAEREWNTPGAPPDGPFAWEFGALDAARRLTTKCLYEAIVRYGQDLRNRQVVGEDLADLIIAYFAACSALNRIRQLGVEAADRTVYRALARLAVATLLEEIWRLYPRLRAVLFSDARGLQAADHLDRELARLSLPFDPVAEIHVLTDDLFHHGRYRFQ